MYSCLNNFIQSSVQSIVKCSRLRSFCLRHSGKWSLRFNFCYVFGIQHPLLCYLLYFILRLLFPYFSSNDQFIYWIWVEEKLYVFKAGWQTHSFTVILRDNAKRKHCVTSQMLRPIVPLCCLFSSLACTLSSGNEYWAI